VFKYRIAFPDISSNAFGFPWSRPTNEAVGEFLAPREANGSCSIDKLRLPVEHFRYPPRSLHPINGSRLTGGGQPLFLPCGNLIAATGFPGGVNPCRTFLHTARSKVVRTLDLVIEFARNF